MQSAYTVLILLTLVGVSRLIGRQLPQLEYYQPDECCAEILG